MPTFTVTIPKTTDGPRVIAALSKAAGFPDVSEENALAAITTFIQATVANVEAASAQQAALDKAVPAEPVVFS